MAAISKRERDAHRRTILSMLETTPATVARAVGPGVPAEPIPDIDFDWRPHPLDRTVSSRRTYRFPIVLGAALAAAVVLIGARFLLEIPGRGATARQAEYVTVLGEFEASLNRLDAAPSVTDPEVAGDFAAAAEALRLAAEEPLPWSIPVLPVGPDLGPAQSRMLAVTDAAVALAAKVAAASRYREAADEIFVIPLLPFEAPPELIDPAAKVLADMQAGSQIALAALDDDPAYEPYRASAAEALDGLSSWIDRYLLALRRGDVTSTAALLADLQGTRSALDAALAEVFAAVDADANATIPTLRSGVEAARVLTG